MPDDTQGTSQNQPDQQTQNDPNAQIGQMVNAAVSNHLKRFVEKQLPEILGSAIGTHLKPLTDKLASQPPADQDPKPKKGEKDPETVALQRRLDEALGIIETEKKARVETEERARADRAYGAAATAIDGKVRGELKDTVLKVFRADGRIVFDEQGNPLFRTGRKDFMNDDEVMPLADGLADWLKQDSAKPFLPAPAAGAGAQQFQKKPSQFSQSQGQQQGDRADPSKMTDRQKIEAAQQAEYRAMAAANNR